MKISRVQMTAAACMAAMLLGGCGDPPYELTETEEKMVVNYSAHVVAKYNVYQNEGLIPVKLEEVKEGESGTLDSEESQHEEEPQAETALQPEEIVSEDDTEMLEETVQETGLNELFGASGVGVEYVGAEFASSFTEGDYYALDPEEGKIYLAVRIRITNTSEKDVDIDNLTLAPEFRAVVNQEEVSAENTILTDDFALFQETLAPGDERETVLLFQVSDAVTQVDSLILKVTLAGDRYQIIL